MQPLFGYLIKAGNSFTAQVTSPENVDSNHRWICIGYSLENDTTIVDATSYTFTNVNSTHRITFHWIEQYSVSFNVNPSGNGQTTPTGNAVWVNTGNLPITATANSNYAFSNWTKTGQITIASSTIASTTATITGPGTITANFESTTKSESTTIIATETVENTTYTVTVGGQITAQQMSNMTITPHATNTTTVVAFTVTGPSGTTGTGTLTLPKEAIPYGTIPEDNTNYYITYSTSFSTHTINIVFAEQETPTTTPTPTPSATSTPTPTASAQPSSIQTAEPTTNQEPTSIGAEWYIAIIAVIAVIGVLIAVVMRKKKSLTKPFFSF